MAIVRNKANGSTSNAEDKSFCVYNRVNAGEPNGALTPQYCGEIILDTTNNVLWKAMGVANDTYVALTA